MPVNLDALERRVATLTERIQKLESRLQPLRAELNQVRRRIDGAKLGRSSVDRRREANRTRNERIREQARQEAEQLYNFSWMDRIAEEYGLTTRQVRRILRQSDMKVDQIP